MKILLDENQEPFIPFVTSDSVFKDGTDVNLTTYIDGYVAVKNEELNNAKIELENDVIEIIRDVNQKLENGEFIGPQGPQGEQGIQGVTGNSGVHTGVTAPTDPNVSIWVDLSDETVIAVAEESVF